MTDQDPQVPPTHEPPAPAPTASVPPTPPAPEQPPAAASARWWEDRTRLAGAAVGILVVAAVGVGGGYALGHAGSGSDAQVAGRFGGQFPGQRGFRGGFQGGPPGAPGTTGQGSGGMDEQHVTGTLTAVGSSSVTVRTSSGSQTYQVTSATQVVQDGASVPLSALKTGEAVLVHVFPGGSGDGTAERVLAGTSASGGGFGPPPGAVG